MAASNPPKGSVSSSSIKPVTRKAVRCQREVAWLVTQAAGRLVATTQDVNAPTPSFVLAAALDFVRQLELAAQDANGHLDYQNVMAPDLQTFCHIHGQVACRAQCAFGRRLHVYALGRGPYPRHLCILQRARRAQRLWHG